LHGELAQALQALGYGTHYAIGDLQQRDRIVDVSSRLISPANTGGHALADGEAGRVVHRTVDAQSAGQALNCLLHARFGGLGMSTRAHRVDIGLDAERHGCLRLLYRADNGKRAIGLDNQPRRQP
jgi:hypothetical protein